MPRAGLTPDKIVARAADLADAGGYDTLSLAVLAEELGVRVPSLYKHVGGLADVQRRLAVAGMRGIGEALRDATVGLAGADALLALGRAYREYAKAHPGRYAAAQRAPGPGDDELRAASGPVYAVVTAVLRGYGLDGDDLVHATRAVRSALHGFVALEAGGGYGLPQDVDESFAVLLRMLDGALRALRSGGPAGVRAR